MLKTMAAVGALLVASALVGPTISQAQTANTYRASYADLNLASENGQQILQRRIAFGARVVCEIEDSRELALASATNLCRGDAIAAVQPAYQAAVNAARHGTVEVIGASAIIVAHP
jgi:UrcA family protein